MKLAEFFQGLGKRVASNPCTYITLCFAIFGICSLGLFEVVFESDPQALWVDFQGRTYAEQEYFNEKFGTYYRINQLILRLQDESLHEDIFTKPYLMRLLAIENAIESKFVELNGEKFNISDLCYSPIKEKGCVVQSPVEFWRLNYTMLHNDADVKYTATCITNNFVDGLPCSSRAGYPVLQEVVLGKTKCKDDGTNSTGSKCSVCYYEAEALLITYLFENNNFTQNIAMRWELDVFEEVINSVNNGTFDYSAYGVKPEDIEGTKPIYITYMAQRSVSDELVTETGSNAIVIVISYLLMFIYVAVAIGNFPNKVYSSFLLGFGGIVIVIAAVCSSMGLTAMLGYNVSLISAEVVPFLILAIGVDNMFIIANNLGRLKQGDIPTRMGETMKEVGPSITAAAICEFLAFFVGASTNIPALQSFCLTASIAVVFDYIFQILAFVAFLALDEKRKQDGKLDVLFCIKAKKVEVPQEDRVKSLIDKYYIPLLFSTPCKIFSFITFFGLIGLTAVGYQNLTLGLEQQISFIENSPIYNYFVDQTCYGEAGPQGYIVFSGVDFADDDNLGVINNMTNDLSRLSTCLVPPIYSWLPQFITALDASDQDFPGRAAACNASMRASLPTYEEKIKDFLNIKLTDSCCSRYGICGEQYADDFVFDEFGKLQVTKFRFNHVPLNDQDSFINSFLQIRTIVDQYSRDLKNGNAFAYAMHYVFFEQYFFIKGLALTNLLLATAIVYSCILLLKNAAAGLMVFLSVLFTTVDIIGLIYLFNVVFGGPPVQINAVSVVNLITAVGLSVEFCAHIILKFTQAVGTREERAKTAVSEMGSSVFVGITCTKFLGVLVLNFAPTPLFRMYYFRMYLSIVLLGSFHGLVFIPIILSKIGPMHKKQKKNSSVLGSLKSA